ncbi:hypothetical protein MYCTH_2311172 [Thermothelomyces thermophilus ATCC 42464]|uniref:Uncharacterized protein n=1 Tax=Thermothelomyces thermophilus (strain ATCC 42464 / BCRC 31852 / DSM 1799) TaxID=573729 RepID=G2QMP2_THET4|nr:uncharacterized protein MYCTH_2311172 [Thermothelomyces thermophilus ATCC 42464]AEO61222.1 hypothetical protein MYCTH_2311172 [Thermothelomyces thermophilus ATCC 42464]
MTSHQVHVANNSGEDIYVLASPNLHWAIVDIAVDTALIAVGVGELGVALQGIKAGGRLKSIAQLALCLKNWGALATATGVLGSRKATEIAEILRAARKANEEINRASIRIPHGNFHRVINRDWIDMYAQISGYAGMAGARTVQLLVKNEDGSQSALFCTGPDHSWIATDRGSIVRANYSRIWVEEPGGRSVDWPKPAASSPVYMDDGEISSGDQEEDEEYGFEHAGIDDDDDDDNDGQEPFAYHSW